MTEDNKKSNIGAELQRAKEELDVAQLLLDTAHLQQSVGRAYYAAFHAAQALILAEGLEARTHSGVGHLVNLHFIRMGRIPAGLSRTLAFLQGQRQTSDYDPASTFTHEQTAAALQEARTFDAAVRTWLRGAGYWTEP